MKTHIVKIQSIKNVTHDVLQIVTEKPVDYNFTPGQATEVAVNKEKWTEEKRPFTFAGNAMKNAVSIRPIIARNAPRCVRYVLRNVKSWQLR